MLSAPTSMFFRLTPRPHVAACRLPEDTRPQILSNEFCEVKIRGEEKKKKKKKECWEKQPTAICMSSVLPAASQSAEQVLLSLAASFVFFVLFCFVFIDNQQLQLTLRKSINETFRKDICCFFRDCSHQPSCYSPQSPDKGLASLPWFVNAVSLVRQSSALWLSQTEKSLSQSNKGATRHLVWQERCLAIPRTP